MLEVRNRTPYCVAVVPGLDRDGRDFATIVIKATFSLGSPPDLRKPLPLADEQVPLVWADEFYGEPDKTSIKHETDVGPAKGGTDVVLVGHAYASKRQVGQVDVTVEAGNLAKTVHVFGDRLWMRGRDVARVPPSPAPFERIPLVYERAFGGADTSHEDESKHGWEKRNPVGTGFTIAGRGDHFKNLALPNLEDPKHLIRSAIDKPPPATFGFVARHWEPRKSFTGTYDEAWQKDRCPLLPLDFDERHFRSAHPDLCAPGHFRGGEPVLIRNATPNGEVRFKVPGLRFEIKTSVKAEVGTLEPSLDTVLIEPDEKSVVVSWKATLACPRKFLLIDYVRVRELERLA